MNLFKITGLVIILALASACSDSPNSSPTNDNAELTSHSASQLQIKQAPIINQSTVTIGNLIWMRCTYGKIWDGETCIGRGKKYTWKQALKLEQSVGFRLPTKTELNSIVFCNKGRESISKTGEGGGCKGNKHNKPAIDKNLFPKTIKNYYWSADSNSANLAWGINFEFGFNLAFNKQDKAYIRLVHRTPILAK